SRRTQAPNQLVNWCRGELVDVKHALLLYGVPESVSITEIEETAETIKVLGKVVVRGKMFHPQQQSLMVLCEPRLGDHSGCSYD
uniref:Paraneoplastic antigen Ma-like N-terminal domain-containing protein n=1 Tax=Amphiprion ocellaris TaxID=80972 RepID=A0AAQ5X7C8_AMPOC